MINIRFFSATFFAFAMTTAEATTLAAWTFESNTSSLPNTPLAPEVGTGYITTYHANQSVYSNLIGNGSSRSLSASNWSVGDYFQFSVSGSGYNSIVLSLDLVGNGKAPRDFAISYSRNGANFSNVLSLGPKLNSWSGASVNTADRYGCSWGGNIALENEPNLYFRLTDIGPASIDGSNPTPEGIISLDNVIVTGQPVPEPESVAGLLFGVAILIRRRQRA